MDLSESLTLSNGIESAESFTQSKSHAEKNLKKETSEKGNLEKNMAHIKAVDLKNATAAALSEFSILSSFISSSFPSCTI